MALSTISLRRAELISFPRQDPSKSPYPDSSPLPTALTEYSPSRSFTIICSGLNRFLPIIPPYQIVFKSLTFGLLCGGRVKSGINSRVWSNRFFRPHTKRSRHRTSATTRPRSIQKKNRQFQTRDQHKNTHKGTRTKMSKEYKDINSGKFKSIGQKEVEQMNGTREMSNEERKQSRRKKKRVGGDAMRHR